MITFSSLPCMFTVLSPLRFRKATVGTLCGRPLRIRGTYARWITDPGRFAPVVSLIMLFSVSELDFEELFFFLHGLYERSCASLCECRCCCNHNTTTATQSVGLYRTTYLVNNIVAPRSYTRSLFFAFSKVVTLDGVYYLAATVRYYYIRLLS
jgi:hypothetical protein